MSIGRIAGRVLRIRWSYWLAAVWLAGVGFYWWHRVPIEPEVVIPLEGKDKAWGYTADGDIVVSRGEWPSEFGWKTTGGPVEIVSSTTGKVRDRRLEHGDKILNVSAKHIAAASRDQTNVVELDSGRTVFSVPTPDYHPTAVFSFDGGRIAIAHGNDVAMYAVESGERLWNRRLQAPGSYSFPANPKSRMSRVNLHSPFHTVLRAAFLGFEHEFLRTTDGQTDTRFSSVDHVDESHDGRLAIVVRGSKKEVFGVGRSEQTITSSYRDQLVYDLVESRQLWAMDGEVNYRRISPDSKEIWEFSTLGGRPTMRRWRAVDGTPIVQQDSPLKRDGYGGIASRDARSLVTWIKAPGLRAPVWVTMICKSLGAAWNGEILPAQEELVLIDQRTGFSRLILAPIGTKRDGGFLENVTGGPLEPERFTVHNKDRISVYRFDSPRNWLWLICAGPGLISLVVGVSQAWTLSRRRLLRAEPTAARAV